MKKITELPVLRRRNIILVCVFLGFLFAQNALQQEIQCRRANEKLTLTSPWAAQTPERFAGTILLGGFRGIAVDILWIRAEALKNQGKFYELLALTKFIANVQPEYPTVWSYLAWNMAYNLSYDTENTAERKAWIVSGIETLKEGIAINPESPQLFFELGQIYQIRLLYEKRMEDAFRQDGIDRLIEANKWFEKMYALPNCPYKYAIILPYSYARKGNIEKGLAILEEMTKRYPQETNLLKTAIDDYRAEYIRK